MTWKKFPLRLWVPVVFAASVSVLLCCCESSYSLMSASPAPLTSFLPDAGRLVPQEPSFPFNRLWYDKSLDWDRMKKIMVAPVDTSHVMEGSWWSQINATRLGNVKKDLDKMGKYMRDSFVAELKLQAGEELKVVDTPDDQTMELHLALVELVPTKAFFNAVGTTVGFFVPGASLVNVVNSGCVAMEGKIIDHKTGRVVAMFTDRESDRSAIINLQDLRWYSHARDIISNWAKCFAEMAASDNPLSVQKPFPFTFMLL